MNFRFLNFKQDIIQEAINLLIEKTILVFPTEKNKKLAIKKFQNTWNFADHKFYSMDEFKRKCFLPDLPLVSDLKQNMAFYNCLSNSDKQYFRINNYFDSINIASQFFNFWQELSDEMIADIDIRKLGYETNIPEEVISWQEKMYHKFVQIRKKYQREINSKNYTDRMFVYVKEKLNADFTNSFNRIVFVNQFYYSALEKEIIRYLNKNIDLVMVYQTSPEMVDQEELKVNNFFLKDMLKEKHATEAIECYQSQNQFLQLVAGFDLIDQKQNLRKIVDSEFYQGLNKEIVSEEYFDISKQVSIETAAIYKFISSWKILITEIEKDKINIQLLYSLLTTDVFKDYYEITLEQRTIIERLIDKGVRYIKIERLNNKRLALDFNLIKMCRDYKSFKKFINTIDINLLRDKYLNRVAEGYFDALLELDETSSESFFSDDIKTPSAYLDLLLISLSKRVCTCVTTKEKAAYISVDSLLDTRNMQYSEVLFFNVSEGVLPTTKRQQLLFNENQRKRLGLKDYDDIVLREKYYFYRLVLSARKVFILSIESEESNTETSSFVEELKLYMPDKVKTSNIVPDTNMYRKFLEYSMTRREVALENKDRDNQLNFNETDLQNRLFSLSFSSLNNLLNCSYRYYLENIIKLKVIKRDKTEDIDMNILGTIIHDIFENIAMKVKEAIDSNQSRSFKEIIGNQGQYTKEQIQKVIHKFSDSIPNRYQKRYMTEILIPLLSGSINSFFQDILDKRIKLENIKAFIPENFSQDEYEKNGIKIAENILIKSRADLRIETKDNKAYVIDYKTGKTNNSKQLDLYELFYYKLRKDKDEIHSIERAFYNVMDNTYDVVEKRYLNEEDIINGVKHILEKKVYEHAKTRSFCQYCNYKEICGKSG